MLGELMVCTSSWKGLSMHRIRTVDSESGLLDKWLFLHVYYFSWIEIYGHTNAIRECTCVKDFEGHDRLITLYLNFESVLEKDCSFTFIIFHGQYLTHEIYNWRFQKILSNFELVMNFGRFGQTRALREFVNSVWKSKCCFLVTIWCTMHHTTMHVLFTYIWC